MGFVGLAPGASTALVIYSSSQLCVIAQRALLCVPSVCASLWKSRGHSVSTLLDFHLIWSCGSRHPGTPGGEVKRSETDTAVPGTGV